MRKALVLALLFLAALPAFAKLHKDSYPVPCSTLWEVVQDTIKNSGNYTLVVADASQMTASYTINGAIRSRQNSVHLEAQGTGCEMQVQTSYSGLAHDDAGDFKNRIDQAVAKLPQAKPAESAKPPEPGK